ncbi:hypothetical protein ACFE04_019702 [Oxalis oulophora]
MPTHPTTKEVWTEHMGLAASRVRCYPSSFYLVSQKALTLPSIQFGECTPGSLLEVDLTLGSGRSKAFSFLFLSENKNPPANFSLVGFTCTLSLPRNLRIDYASAEVSTRYGILGVKVWISYSKKEENAATEEWLVSALPHLEETAHSWMVRGSGASTSGEDSEPPTSSWKSFDERVLLEPMPSSSSSSVNEPSHTEEALDPEALMKKKVELHTLVREQLRHYCERGRPKWRLSDKKEDFYSEATDQILSDLEMGTTISEYEAWIKTLKSSPTTLAGLYKEYKP